jgi:hypothetical protein
MIARKKDHMAINLKTTNMSSAMVSAINPKTGKLAPQPFTASEAAALVSPGGKQRQLLVNGEWADLFVITPKEGPLAKSGHVLIGVALKGHVITVESKLQIVEPREKKAPKPKAQAASVSATFGLDLASEVAAFAAACDDETDENDETGAGA